MRQKIFSVYDNKARAFSTPFFTVNRDVGIRHFERAVNDPSVDFHHHPSDFNLFELGEFETETGVITPYDKQVNLGLGSQYLREIEP